MTRKQKRQKKCRNVLTETIKQKINIITDNIEIEINVHIIAITVCAALVFPVVE